MPIPRITKEEVFGQLERLQEFYGLPVAFEKTQCFSENFVNTWYEIFKEYSKNQMEKAVTKTLESDSSVKYQFPLPGRVKKHVPLEGRYTQDELIEMNGGTEEEKARKQQEEHEWRMQTDPEYAERCRAAERKFMERIEAVRNRNKVKE